MSSPVIELLQNEKKFIQVARNAFDSIDTDGSGSIDEDEFTVAMRDVATDLGMDQPSREDVLEVLRDLDKDSNGKIDFEEFKIFFKDILNSMI